MNPAASSSTVDETSGVLSARIDAQEESFVQPLREYLESNDCRVISGHHTGVPVAYHIVAGDESFVKQIIPHGKIDGAKTLGIFVGSGLTDAKNLATENCKCVVVDPTLLTHDDVVEIFSFFFAGSDNILDKRRNRHVQPEGLHVGVPTEEPLVRASEEVVPLYAEEALENLLSKNDEDRIGSIIGDVFKDENEEHQSKKRGPYRKHKKPYQRILAGVFFGIAILCIPFLWYGGSVAGAGMSFGLAGKNLETGNFSKALRWEQIGGYWLSQSTVSFGLIRIPFSILGLSQAIRGQERLLSFLQDTKSAFSQTHDVITLGKDVSRLVFAGSVHEQKTSPAVTLDKLRLSVSSLNGSLGLAQAQLSTLLADMTFPFSLRPIYSLGLKTSTSLISIRSTLSYMDQMLLLYPRIAGFDGAKTYLVLLQNSSELRPTGGFIGSIGKLTFDGGMVSDFTIQDVYAVDGQLKGHVDPPLPIRELMSQEHWYLRDSNWDPDFEISGERARWFYEKETGESVDGVIALSLPLVVDLLKATGPIVLSDYNDQITADNFLGKSIYYTKNNFFPGSTAKSDFLGTLARTLLLKLTTDTHLNPAEVFEAVVSGLQRRDIQFMFVSPELQDLVSHFGWAGDVYGHVGCAGVEISSCVYDPFFVNEANLSVSKVNAFINHTNHREIVIAPTGEITETVTLTLENNATDEPGVGGTYKSYLRFFLPDDSSISDVTLDGVPIASRDVKDKALPTLPYIESVEGVPGFSALGAAIEIPPGTNRRLRISYARRSLLVVNQKEAILDVGYIKQSGMSDVKLSTTIHYPIFWKAKDLSAGEPNLVAKDGQFEYNTSLLADQFIRVQFTK
jgi:hypothetical protein